MLRLLKSVGLLAAIVAITACGAASVNAQESQCEQLAMEIQTLTELIEQSQASADAAWDDMVSLGDSFQAAYNFVQQYKAERDRMIQDGLTPPESLLNDLATAEEMLDFVRAEMEASFLAYVEYQVDIEADGLARSFLQDQYDAICGDPEGGEGGMGDNPPLPEPDDLF